MFQVLLLERSRDLKTWEASPFNQVLAASPEDKLVLDFNPAKDTYLGPPESYRH